MYKKLALFLLAVIAFTCCTGPDRGNYYKISGFAQGTSWNITYAMLDSVNLKPQIDSILKAFDQTFSVYEPNSLISGINRNELTEVSDEFKRVFELSSRVWKESNGYFDITVMPLVDAWGFGPGPKTDIESSVIDSLLKFVGMEKVRLVNNRIVKDHPGVRMDMNAIAKGYSVDVVSGYFDSKGMKNYMVEIGGEIRTRGVNPSGQIWRIGIDRPYFGNMFPGQQLQAILQLKNHGLATSGNYRNYYEENGVKYAHSINPGTGYPVRHNLLSATVIARDCITADAWATAFMVMGLEKSIEILEKQKELEAYLIFGDEIGQYQVYTTKGMKSFIFREQ